MKIDPHYQIADLQKAFSKRFPGLKIEFYRFEHGVNEGSPIKHQLEPATVLSDVLRAGQGGNIAIVPSMTVSELEHLFETLYGLHVQVFRRSASLWLQTTKTDDWTLEVQNTKGIHSLQSA